MTANRQLLEPRWCIVCASAGLLAIVPTLLYALSILPSVLAGFFREPVLNGESAMILFGTLALVAPFFALASFYIARFRGRSVPLLRAAWVCSALGHLALAVFCAAGAYRTITRMSGTQMPFDFAVALVCTSLAIIAFIGSACAVPTASNQRA